MRRLVLIALTLAASMVAAGSAQAVVVNDGGQYGVALVPSSREGTSTTASYLATAGISSVNSSGPCADPAAGLEPDVLTMGSWPLNETLAPVCWHYGAVLHRNETFTLAWEGHAPNTYWSGTKNFVEQYLRDVATASGSLSSPYSDTTQYWDGPSVQDRAANASVFGGGCDDNGTAQCKFSTGSGSGPGTPLPAISSCPVSGTYEFGQGPGGGWVTASNNLCITDADVRGELSRMIATDGLVAHTQSGYTPLVVVLTPPGVNVCIDSSGTLCSANSTAAKAQFCSYHGFDSQDGVAYVVQPWTPFTGCDDPIDRRAAPESDARPGLHGGRRAARRPAQPGRDRGDRQPEP